jgi:metallo-beta-lactamase class B
MKTTDTTTQGNHGCPCCNGGQPPITDAAVDNTEIARHLRNAQIAAGSDLTTYLRLANATHPDVKAPTIEEMMNWPAPEPGRAFDNFYFLGSCWVSAWALITSDGIILIDTMDNDEEAERFIEVGLRKLGFDPADIKIILITHGHGDHYGGASYLSRKYHPRILMSHEDWDLIEHELDFDFPNWGRPPVRGESIHDGDIITLGATSVQVMLTPGHTYGTVSLLLNVLDRGNSLKALLWGGTAFNFGNRPDRLDRLEKYIHSVLRGIAAVREHDVTVFISNHNLYDDAVRKINQYTASYLNPFVTDVQTVCRALRVMEECARATLISWQSSPEIAQR